MSTPGSSDHLSPEALQNISIGKTKKDSGDQAFKAGDLKSALKGYHEALLYFRGVHRQQPAPFGEGPQEKKKTEVDDLMEKVYSNMSACHLKQKNWERAIETANQALAINENNYKALFRKGKAQAEIGFFEKAEKTLEELLKKNPADAPTIQAELMQIRAKDKERERQHNKKLRGFLSRDKNILASDASNKTGIASPPEAPSSARIEEVVDEPN